MRFIFVVIIFKDFYVKNVVCNGAEKAIFIRGIPEMHIKNINLENMTLQAKIGVDIQEASAVNIKNVNLITKETNPLLYVLNSDGIVFDKITYKSAETFIGVEGERNSNIKILNTDKIFPGSTISIIGKWRISCKGLIISKKYCSLFSPRNFNKMPRILAIDYGQKRTGIAVTDELQIIASGLTTIPSATAIDFLKDYFSKEKVEAVLIGEPKQMNGQPSESASIIKGFVTHFTNHFPDIKVIRVDERFTSKMAFQSMIDNGMSKKQRQNKALIDEISATIMLQDYLTRKMF
jgi:putative Holliday junction resolvase